MKLFYFPRSLRQLVLLAFLLVLLPLLFLANQAYRSFDKLSRQAEQINRMTLTDSLRSEAMNNLSLSMERSYRQFCVVGESSLELLYQRQYQEYSLLLEEHRLVVPLEGTVKNLETVFQLLGRLACHNSKPIPLMEQTLRSFSKDNIELGQLTRTIVFSRGQYLQKSLASHGQSIGRQSLVLFLFSLGLVLLLTHMIIGPVNQIKLMIAQLGAGERLSDLSVFRGPQELRSLAQRIVWLSERLTWLELQRYEFLRHLSHELKTPLASMREGTELLADNVVGPLTEEQREVVEILEISSKHLQKLIEQLLDYNRNLSAISAGKIVNVLAPLIENIVMAHQLPVKMKSMVTKIMLHEASCWAQPSLLVKTIDNLYSNAVHYGEESGTIWITSSRQEQYMVLDIANTGEPITKQEREKLFEPFFQGYHQNQRKVKSSGLGLSIARDCVHKMQGELSLVDVDYADVCFRIKLPLLSVGND